MQGLKVEDLYKLNYDTKETRLDILIDMIKSGKLKLITEELVYINPKSSDVLLSDLEKCRSSNKFSIEFVFKFRQFYREILEVVNSEGKFFKIKLNQIAKSDEFKGKKSSANILGAKLTEQQENLTIQFINSLINENKKLIIEPYDDITPEWIESSLIHARLMKNFLQSSDFKRYNVYRNEENIQRILKLIEPFLPNKLSSWCPADIWMIAEECEEEIYQELYESITFDEWDLVLINLFLESLFLSKKFIPVSLKKVNSNYEKMEVYNLQNLTLSNWSLKELRFLMNWKDDRKIEMTSKDTTLYAEGYKDSNLVDLYCQMKQYPWMIGNIQMEGKSKKAIARYGKIPTNVIDNFFEQYSKQLNHLGRVKKKDTFLNLDLMNFNKPLYKSMFKKIKEVFNEIFITNFNDEDEFIEFLEEVNESQKRINTKEREILENYFISKMQGFKFMYDFALLQENDLLNECLISFYKGALKINNSSCAYLKLG